MKGYGQICLVVLVLALVNLQPSNGAPSAQSGARLHHGSNQYRDAHVRRRSVEFLRQVSLQIAANGHKVQRRSVYHHASEGGRSAQSSALDQAKPQAAAAAPAPAPAVADSEAGRSEDRSVHLQHVHRRAAVEGTEVNNANPTESPLIISSTTRDPRENGRANRRRRKNRNRNRGGGGNGGGGSGGHNGDWDDWNHCDHCDDNDWGNNHHGRRR